MVKGRMMKTETFLKTGEFARLCHTTKETLFHYDREDILRPRYVSENGYRRYGVEQYFDFDLITLLKETGSSLGEIKSYRDACDPHAYLRLLRERVTVLRRERARLVRREAMLEKLVTLTEEALEAEYDVLFFEEREPERILVTPTDPEKMRSCGGTVECYATCLAHDMERGDDASPPLGMVIPEENARNADFRLCHFFTRAEAEDSGDIREIPGGRYAVLFHRGEFSSQAMAFGAMVAKLKKDGIQLQGDTYIYDLMSYFLTDSAVEYAAKHIVRVK